MIRPSRATALPNYAASGMSIPSGGDYGYSRTASSSSHDSSYYSSNSNQYQQQNNGQGGYSHQYDDSFKDKPRRSRKGDLGSQAWKHLRNPITWAFGAAAFFLILTIHYRGQRNWILRSFQATSAQALFNAFHDAQGHLTRCRDEMKGVQSSEFEMHHHITSLEAELKLLKKERDVYKQKLDTVSSNQSHIATLTARDFAWKEQVEVLQNATQRESKRSATELFGPGPHHVRFTIVLPNDEKETERHFIVETASLDLMPHAVHVFLQQVVHGLWNNAWFYLNGPHVLQGGPQATEDDEELYKLSHKLDDERALALKKFREANLDSLAFPEYSEKFPHLRWTLGFTGRPGGPDFYINKLDNTKVHGPGGQSQHDLKEYGDPCFAKVVDGFDVLEDMYKEPTYGDDNDWAWFLEDPIHIVSAKLMENAPMKIEPAFTSEDHSRKPAKPLAKHHIEHQVTP